MVESTVGFTRKVSIHFKFPIYKILTFFRTKTRFSNSKSMTLVELLRTLSEEVSWKKKFF